MTRPTVKTRQINRSFWRFGIGCRIGLLALALVALSACGPNGQYLPPTGSGSGGNSSSGSGSGSSSGSSGGSGSGGTPPPVTTPVPGLNANGDLVDDTAIYAQVPQGPVDNINVTVLPPLNPAGGCTDGNGHGHGPGLNSGTKDYSGCTLADLNGVRGDNGFDPEVPVQVTTADGQLNKAHGEMELSGHSTLQAPQKSYKIKLDKNGQRWFGQRRVVLKKHPYDLTRIRNTLAFTLFRQIPDFPSRRLHFMHLYMADRSGSNTSPQDYGLFEYIEENKDDWLAAHGQDPKGELWKAGHFSFVSVQATPGLQQPVDSDAFKSVIKAEGKHYDPTTLLDMIRAVNDNKKFLQTSYCPANDLSCFKPVFDKYFHPDNFRTWLATNILVGNLDTTSQNYYLYRPSALTKFYFLPWDYDGAFDWQHQFGRSHPEPRWTQGLGNWWGMVLVRRYIETPGEVQKLTDKIDQLHSTVFNSVNVTAAINTLPLADIKAIIETPPDIDHLPHDGSSNPSKAQQLVARAYGITHRVPDSVEAAFTRYKANLERPMPVYQNVVADKGKVTLKWNTSYDIQGDALVYDVKLATSPDLNATDAACTAQPGAPVPQLSNGVIFQKTGVKNTRVPVPGGLVANQLYYFKVVVRDSKGYCQTAFDHYEDASGKKYFGVYAFSYDPRKPAGEQITQH